VDEAQVVNGLYRHDYLGHVEAGYVLGEDQVFDKHGHEVATGEELHEHVQELVVLERSVKLYHPCVLVVSIP